jgi:hypothetical protein
VQENQLQSLPANLGGPSLTTMHLQGNPLVALPASLHRCSGLRALSLEWFCYLEPPQGIHQAGTHGEFVIRQVREFTGASMSIPGERIESSVQLSFVEFLLYFHVCRKLQRTKLTAQEATGGLNGLRFGQKKRCIVQHLCSNKHLHLLREVVDCRGVNPFSQLVNQEICLNTLDAQD